MANIDRGDDVADVRRIKRATEEADPLTRFSAHSPQLTAGRTTVRGTKNRNKYLAEVKKPTSSADG